MTEEKEKKIHKDMKIGEVVKAYPAAAEVMMEYGLHCIGCHVAEWETLEQGCKAHGISDQEIKKMIDELNTPAILEGKRVYDEKEVVNDTGDDNSKKKEGFFKRLRK